MYAWCLYFDDTVMYFLGMELVFLKLSFLACWKTIMISFHLFILNCLYRSGSNKYIW